MLNQALSTVRRRALAIGITAGVGWALVGVLLLLILFAWADLALDLPATVRAVCGWSAIIFGLAVLLKALFTSIASAAATVIARRLDQVSNSNGQILTGVDLLHQYGSPAAAGATDLSRGLAHIAIERASRLAAQVRAAHAIPAKPIAWATGTVGALAVFIGVVAIASPRLVASQWLRFTDPFGDHPPYSSIALRVTPGDTKVLYGASLDVHATPVGGSVDRVELVFKPASASAEESVPMFPESDGSWRGAVSDLTTPGTYFIRATGARTRKFQYDLITVPEVRGVRFRVTPPAYTHLPPYEGPLPQGGLAGLVGTKIEFWIRSNRPLSAGTGDFVADAASTTQPSTAPTTAATPSAVAANPTSPGASEVTGSFIVRAAGKLRLNITDVDGQRCREPFVAPVSVLIDARPFVRITEPRPESFATPDVTLNVQIAAEDDYGISRLQLFRGLNDSRVLPTEIPVPPSQPTRLPASVPLNLADYGLEPGDVVKLYARVEDNDPAGAKGTETPVVLVHVISKEDFDRMVLAREGLEVLEAKYAQAMRRLESLDNRLAAVQDELGKLPPDSPLADEKRKEIEDLANDMDKEAAAVDEAARQDLPFDLDKNLKQQLDKVAQDIRDAAKETRETARGQSMSNAQAAKSLDKPRQRLGARKQDFKENAADPLDRLANLFPLVEDEARFVDLWKRQNDLAERMKSVEQVNAEDPSAKARMRDLQSEQQKLRDDLRDLLADIENHAAALRLDTPKGEKPDETANSKLEELRKSAQDFVRAARQSGAAEQMAEAEQKLEEFAGSPALVKSRQAAAALESLIAQCKSMGDQGEAQMRFQPTLAQALGNTIDQLLEAEGLGGSKPGRGMGTGGGFSQRRSSLRNVGLYGRRPTGRPAAGRGGQKGLPGAGGGADGRLPEVFTGNIDAQRLQGSGASEAAVPAQYKQKVGEYFQRVADELGDNK
jgi:hypothetical protein